MQTVHMEHEEVRSAEGAGLQIGHGPDLLFHVSAW